MDIAASTIFAARDSAVLLEPITAVTATATAVAKVALSPAWVCDLHGFLFE